MMQAASFFLSKKVADTVLSMTDGTDRKTTVGTAICLLLDSFDAKDRTELVSDILTANEPKKEKKLLDKSEVLAILNIGNTTLYNMTCSGEFPQPVKIGKKSMWTHDDVNSYIKRAVRRRSES